MPRTFPHVLIQHTSLVLVLSLSADSTYPLVLVQDATDLDQIIADPALCAAFGSFCANQSPACKNCADFALAAQGLKGKCAPLD
jgi:hypothetical protein